MRRLILTVLTLAIAVGVVAREQDGCTKTVISTTGVGVKLIVAAPAAGQLVICQGSLDTTSTTTITLAHDGHAIRLTTGRDVPLPPDTLPMQTALILAGKKNTIDGGIINGVRLGAVLPHGNLVPQNLPALLGGHVELSEGATESSGSHPPEPRDRPASNHVPRAAS